MEKDKFTIKDLDLFYGDFQALKKISMHIPEKEITAFIGPSGCGKSTLFNLMTKNLKPDQGEVFLREENIANLR